MSSSRLPLSEEIYNQILVRITEGAWPEGEKLPSESKLCEMFHVSRVSVRAAIQKLQGQGLVETMPGVGSFVSRRSDVFQNDIEFFSDITGEAYMELFEFRQAIEFKAIELFVVRATHQDEQALKKAVEQMNDCGEDRKEFTKYDYAFHMAVIEGSKNMFLINAINNVKSAFYHYLDEITRLSKKSNNERYREHKRLGEAILMKKPSLAKEMLLEDNQYYHETLFSKVK